MVKGHTKRGHSLVRLSLLTGQRQGHLPQDTAQIFMPRSSSGQGHLVLNQKVMGSNPIRGANFRMGRDGFKVRYCKGESRRRGVAGLDASLRGRKHAPF